MKMFLQEDFTWVFWRRDVPRLALVSVSNFDPVCSFRYNFGKYPTSDLVNCVWYITEGITHSVH
jgi:hypothetical protein